MHAGGPYRIPLEGRAIARCDGLKDLRENQAAGVGAMIEHLGRMIIADPAGAMAFVVAFALWAWPE